MDYLNYHQDAAVNKSSVFERLIIAVLIFSVTLIQYRPTLAEEIAVPRQPSVVEVRGRQLIVKKRLPDNSLTSAEAYVLKGVCWSPSSKGMKGLHEERQAEFSKWLAVDLALMSEMKLNTVYVFLDFGLDSTALAVLDALYRHGIMAVVTVDKDGTNDLERLEKVVNYYKDHPAILFWAIGNEWNINLYHRRFNTLDDAAVATERAAKLIKKLDPQHPVAAIFGEIIIPHQSLSTREIVNKIVPSVDIWGLNIYRGGKFGTLFEQWKSLSDKPIFISEFGTDSYYSEKWWPVFGRIDEQMQAQFVGSLWQDLKKELSAIDPSKSVIGGAVFEWVDEWWKTARDNPANASVQDAGGFPTPWNKYSHPDSFANEEYFGILRLDRSKKPVFEVLKKEFGGE